MLRTTAKPARSSVGRSRCSGALRRPPGTPASPLAALGHRMRATHPHADSGGAVLMSLRGAYPADRDGRVVHGAERLAGSPSSGSRQAPTQACEIIPKLRKRAIGVDGRAERFGDLLAVCDSELFRKLASGQGEDIFLEQERSRARGLVARTCSWAASRSPMRMRREASSRMAGTRESFAPASGHRFSVTIAFVAARKIPVSKRSSRIGASTAQSRLRPGASTRTDPRRLRRRRLHPQGRCGGGEVPRRDSRGRLSRPGGCARWSPSGRKPRLPPR